MNNPTFNLAQVAIHPTWYDHLDAVEGAMAECARVEALRYSAGWEADEGGWYSPDGIHEVRAGPTKASPSPRTPTPSPPGSQRLLPLRGPRRWAFQS
jgi:hypothetical protein